MQIHVRQSPIENGDCCQVGGTRGEGFFPPCSRGDLQDGSQVKYVGKDDDQHSEQQVKPTKADVEVNTGAREEKNWGFITEKLVNFIGFAKVQLESKTCVYRSV